ncbi:MAG: hypothetical protein EA394_11465 [Bacteroidia bacterium]|nr:MAG: hypothetical protein EA394_11465 [Bacteroidia bacterium]
MINSSINNVVSYVTPCMTDTYCSRFPPPGNEAGRHSWYSRFVQALISAFPLHSGAKFSKNYIIKKILPWQDSILQV